MGISYQNQFEYMYTFASGVLEGISMSIRRISESF